MSKIQNQITEYNKLGIKKTQTFTKAKQIKLHKQSYNVINPTNTFDNKSSTIRKERQLNITQFDKVINNNSPTNRSLRDNKEKRHKGSEYSIEDLNNFNVEFFI